MDQTDMMYRRDVEDLLAYLEVAAGIGDGGIAVRRSCILHPGIGRATVRHVEEYAMRNGIGFGEALRQADQIDRLTGPARAAIAEYLAFVDLLKQKAREGPGAVVQEVMTHVLAPKTRSPQAERDIKKFIAFVQRYDKAGPRQYSSLAGPERIRTLTRTVRNRDFRTLPFGTRLPRIMRLLATGHVVLALVLLLGFGWASLGVDLKAVDARIVEQMRADQSRVITVEFEHEGQRYRTSAVGDFEAAEGAIVTAWFASDDPTSIKFARWEHFIGPVVVVALLVAWLAFAIVLRRGFGWDPWR